MHEADLYDKNSFLTLTYSDEHLPSDGSLKKRDFQLFMKRLRKNFSGEKIRFFHCGEYGEQLSRPHYHALLFGIDFSEDRELWKVENGNKLFRSPTLDLLWGKGHALVGDLTFESAAYCARYSLKKITGDGAEAHYGGKQPEYCTMSRRPGIGAGWYQKFSSDVFPSDSVILRGREMLPPKFYDKLLEKENPLALEAVKRLRQKRASKRGPPDPFRLRDGEVIKNQQIRALARKIES